MEVSEQVRALEAALVGLMSEYNLTRVIVPSIYGPTLIVLLSDGHVSVEEAE